MVQITEQSREQKIKMYRKLTKDEIINMLIECNMIIDGHNILQYNNNANLSAWECPRCYKINAFWVMRCDCLPLTKTNIVTGNDNLLNF